MITLRMLIVVYTGVDKCSFEAPYPLPHLIVPFPHQKLDNTTTVHRVGAICLLIGQIKVRRSVRIF